MQAPDFLCSGEFMCKATLKGVDRPKLQRIAAVEDGHERVRGVIY